MKRTVMVFLTAFVACTPASDTPAAEEEEAGQGVEMPAVQAVPEGPQQLLVSRNGRFHKGGWNHYGPGYFEPTTEWDVQRSNDRLWS